MLQVIQDCWITNPNLLGQMGNHPSSSVASISRTQCGRQAAAQAQSQSSPVQDINPAGRSAQISKSPPGRQRAAVESKAIENRL
jgi:hypothetical protein